jgi:hypothetical protein
MKWSAKKTIPVPMKSKPVDLNRQTSSPARRKSDAQASVPNGHFSAKMIPPAALTASPSNGCLGILPIFTGFFYKVLRDK